MDRNLYSIYPNYESLCEKRRFHATKRLLLLYVYMFIEAMADAAVAQGLPRKQAYKFAAKAVMGSAKMVLETGKHPGELKDMVCSPAGTTIEAVKVLEAAGFRSALMEAMEVCAEKSRNM